VKRFLALSPSERQRVFAESAAIRGLSASSIEKDFWVTITLRELFAMPMLDGRLTFKGGTSLSKAWGLIDRFSEDVDLTLDRALFHLDDADDPERAPSNSARQRRLETIQRASTAFIERALAPALIERLTRLIGAPERWEIAVDPNEPQTLLFTFPHAESGGVVEYVRPIVRLEFGARSDPWPTEARWVTALVAMDHPTLFDDPGGIVSALTPARTFLEKLMLLHEETFRPASKPRRLRLSRHYYDVARLILAGVGEAAIADEPLFARVAEHRQLYYRQTWVDYATLRRGSIRLLPPPDQADEWRRDYDAMQGTMLGPDAPTFEELLDTVGTFERTLNGVPAPTQGH
jgi:hypothetical protein